MVNKQQIETIHKPSALERFNISFEFDKTLTEVKRDVKNRTI